VSSQCTVLVSGFLARTKIVGDREQILAFHVPGDFPDLQTLHLPVLDHDLVSIGPSRVGLISHEHLKNILGASRTLTHVFWRETLVDAAMFREWVSRVTARDALGIIAHLICELAVRLQAVGLVQTGSFHVPFTQQDFASASGLSSVHVNRTMQELRRRGLLKWENKEISLLDFEGLERVAEFNPDYLHLHARPR
jgi:CRP-like cAMP-binding protein